MRHSNFVDNPTNGFLSRNAPALWTTCSACELFQCQTTLAESQIISNHDFGVLRQAEHRERGVDLAFKSGLPGSVDKGILRANLSKPDDTPLAIKSPCDGLVVPESPDSLTLLKVDDASWK